MTHEEALFILKNTAWLGTEADRKKVEEALNVLEQPSVQPEVAKDTNVPCKDTISRHSVMVGIQSLIEDLPNKCKGNYNIERLRYLECLEVVNHAPSAQPEIVRCKDCKYGSPNKVYGCRLERFSYLDEDVRMYGNDFCSMAERRTDESKKRAMQ